MCTVKEIREAIREDCHSQHDMESTEIDRVLQTLPFSQGNEPVGQTVRSQTPLFGSMQENLNKTADCHNSFYRIVAFFIPREIWKE